MYTIPLILGGAIFLIFLFGTVLIGLTAVNFKSMGTTNGTGKILSKEYRDQLIKAYNKAFASKNMDAMTDMLTEYMYYTTKCTLGVLKKLGLRKEVEFTPDPQFESNTNESQFNIVQSDGKNDFTISTMTGEYKETYYDVNTDKVVYSHKKKTSYTIHFLKCNESLRDKPCHCMNCGDELTANGNMLDCPSCGTHYQAENYDWNISDIQVSADDANPWVKPVLIGSAVILLISAIEAVFIRSVLLFILLILIDAAAGVMTYKYLCYVNTGISVLKELQKNDPKSSRLVLFKRINFLIRTLEQARDYNLQDAKAFMTEELYKELKAANEYDDYYLVDFEITKMYPYNYRVKDGNQYMDLELSINRLIMNAEHKVKLDKVKAQYTVFKSIDAMTVTNTSAQAITCPNCGANINVVRDGKCTYCETGLDISKHDWIFSGIPLELTK